MLALEGVNLYYGRQSVLQQITASIRPGTLTAVLGPNGAGKSSLLQVAGGALPGGARVDGGVLFQGRPLPAWPLRDKARVMAVLPQRSRLEFDFTAREVVELGRMPHATGRESDRHIVGEALAAVDAGYLAQRFFPRLSGGEQQRVQLARVLAQAWHPPGTGTAMLVLDEPTSALDLAHQQQVLSLLRDRARGGDAVLVALHDLNLAGVYADQVLLLDDGRLRAAGPPDEVLCDTLLEEVFGLQFHRIAHPRDGRPWLVY